MASHNVVQLNVGGIQLNVHANVALDVPDSKPVVVMFLLHGRKGQADSFDNFIVDLLNDNKYTGDKDVLVVTFDHRNHGQRIVDSRANGGWKLDPSISNKRHAIDMYSIFAGTAKDVSYLIDFLPSFIFPSGERVIAEWGVLGVSLGGHSTWLLLCHEPRVTFGIPVIGCPDYLKLMTSRAAKYGIDLEEDSPYMPASSRAYIRKMGLKNYFYDKKDANNSFLSKKILVLSGGADELVPWVASKEIVDRLEVGDGGYKKVFVEEGVGHKFSPRMFQEAIAFVNGIVVGKTLDNK